MNKYSERKNVNKTLQFRAASEICELIEIIVNEANLKVIQVGGNQRFNNSDILKLAIQGLVRDDICIEITGERFSINDLTKKIFSKFEGEFSDIIDKDKLKIILRVGVVKFIEMKTSLLDDELDDTTQGDYAMKSIISDICCRYRSYNQSDNEEDCSINFDDFIDNYYNNNNIFSYKALDFFNNNKISDIDNSESCSSNYTKYYISEEDIEFTSGITDEAIKEDLRSIDEYLKSYFKVNDLKFELEEYLEECILNLDEFYGINAYKVKDSYKQIRYITILKSIVESYVDFLLVK